MRITSTRTVARLSDRRRLRQSQTAATDEHRNVENGFHHHSDLLHELVAARRARLRDGAG